MPAPQNHLIDGRARVHVVRALPHVILPRFQVLQPKDDIGPVPDDTQDCHETADDERLSEQVA